MFSRAYVEITNVCNLACAFCPGTAREKRFMTPETFALLAGKLRPYTDFLYLHVMGEPLLHPQLAEILHICEELGFRVCLTTNGTLLPEKLPLLLESSAIHKVSVSLHSFEGNGRSDGMEEYVERVADSCLSLAGGGVICALRLWNQGGADAENFRILRVLDRMMKKNTETLPRDRRGNRRLEENLYLEEGEKFLQKFDLLFIGQVVQRIGGKNRVIAFLLQLLHQPLGKISLVQPGIRHLLPS